MILHYKNSKARNFGRISYLYGILFIIWLACLYVVVYFINNALPTPLSVVDEAEHPDQFITERARRDLKSLTDLGPRMVGTPENEVLAVGFLRNAIADIIEEANANQEVEFDLQVATGSYYLAYRPYGSINAYANLQNVVVKVHSGNANANSVLINAHFDTVPTSPGGSDDGINCAIMLEVLRKISKSSRRPRNNLLFLFNGGEESNIQASHGFITQHKWAGEVKVVVNLEATGGGGKELLFQAGPDQAWLMDYYSRVPHPRAQALGEEIFQSNIIPSDSDFRIFRDFGNTIGYDFAYIKDGYRYHTKYDGFDNIEEGIFQHSGDNILELVRGLADAPEVDDARQNVGGAVFFDFVGLFFIYYTENVALIINVLTLIVSIALMTWCFIEFRLEVSWETVKYVCVWYVAVLIGWILSAGFVALLALILGAADRTMSWYGIPTITFSLYCAPVLGWCLTPLILFNKHQGKTNPTAYTDVLIQLHLMRFLWTIIIIVGVGLGIRSMYIPIVPMIFNIFFLLVIHVFKLHRYKIWPIVYLIGTVLPTMLTMYLAHELLALFIPLCGRFGSGLNPEFMIGLFIVLLTVLITYNFVPFIGLLNRPSNILFFLGGIFLAGLIVICTPMGFPYSGDPDVPAAQRFPIFHTNRVFRDEGGNVVKNDSGFYFRRMDYNSPDSIRTYVDEIDRAVSLKKDCEAALFCGLPVVYSRDFEELENNIWIPAASPAVINDYEKAELTLNSVINVGNSNLRYNFTVSGPPDMDIYLSPKPDVKFVDTNLNPFIPSEQPLWKGRPTLYVLYVHGKEPAPLNFFVDFEVLPNSNGQAVIDIAITGKYEYSKTNRYTEQFQQFLNKFPEWTVFTTVALATYESWIF